MVRTLAWSLQGSGRGKAQRSKQREAEKGTEAQRKGQRSREIAEAQRARGKQRIMKPIKTGPDPKCH